VPPDILTHHFINRDDANTYFHGKCFRTAGLRSNGQLILKDLN
jgi:hypothetical protein